jgi:serine/threonine-protein kinase
MFMGTPGYLSPEQCLDEDIDQRTDIYSLGVSFYEMLTGITPLSADSPLALLRQIIDVEPKDVGELRPEVPEALRVILRKMMAKKPADRYADCAALIVDLQAWLETAGSTGSDISAAIAATMAAPSSGTNTETTVVVDSAQMAGNKAGGPPPGGKRMSAAVLTAVIVVLIAGVGYAAWHFGIATDTEIMALEDKDKFGGMVRNDAATVIENATEPEAVAEELSKTSVNVSDEVITGDAEAEVTTGYAEALPENLDEPTFDPEIAQTTLTDPDISTDVTQPGYDEPQINFPAEQVAAYSPPPTPEPAIGTGVALVSVGEILLADSAADYVRQTLERHGIAVLDGMAIAGVANMLENGGGAIEELIRPHARYLVFIRADFTGERDLYYMGRHDTEFQARLNLETRDLLDGRPVGPGIHTSIGYTRLSVEGKIEDILRPKFGPIAGDLTD